MRQEKVRHRRKNGKFLVEELEKIAENVLDTVDFQKTTRTNPKQADIFLLSHKEMARLKKKFLPREKGPPNVLAFPEPKHWPHPEKKNAGLGEIYLNQDLAKRDIQQLAPLLVHGIVHLLGYDHKKKSDRIQMEKIENSVIKKLGYYVFNVHHRS